MLFAFRFLPYHIAFLYVSHVKYNGSLSIVKADTILFTDKTIVDNDLWRIAFFSHVFSSILLLPAGFTQFRLPANPRRLQVHRSFGKLYVVIILFVSGPAGFIMGVYANGGITSQVAFVTLDLLWLFTTAKAWISIRSGNLAAHKDYMLRSYALTLSAVTLRAWKYLIVIFLHPHPMDVYRVVAWLGWVPNILVAEFLIYKRLYPPVKIPPIKPRCSNNLKISGDGYIPHN